MTGEIIPREQHTALLVDLVAVAVSASILTFSGTRLLTTPISEKALRNVLPLHLSIHQMILSNTVP